MIGLTFEIQNLSEPLLSEWEHLAQQTKAAPFLWPGWVNAWWGAFGKGQLQIFTVYENGHLTGVLPLHRQRRTLSSTTNAHTPQFGFLADSEVARKQLSNALFSRKARRIDLCYLSPTDASVSLTRAAADAASYRALAQSMQAPPYLTIDGDWNAYETGLRGQFRRDLHRRRRRLENEGRVTLEVSDGKERLNELLDEGFLVEELAWKGAQGSSINSSPATRRFYTEVAHWAAGRGWLRLAFLRLDGRALAFDYCLEYNKIHYMMKTGYDPVYARFSPGRILRYLMLARAFSEGLATYDLGGMPEAWKLEWTDTCQERLFLHMFPPTALGGLDREVFVFHRSALEGAKRFVRSPVVGERGRTILKRIYARLNQ